MEPIKRQLQQVLQKQLFNGKAIIVIGARQVGKTTLFEQLLHDAHLPNEQILKIYCDDAPSRQLLENASLADLRQLLAGKRVVMVDNPQTNHRPFQRGATVGNRFVLVYVARGTQ